LPAQLVRADETKLSAAELERIKQEVMQELRANGFLQQEIENGILAYIQKQREQQAAAQAAEATKLAERAKNVRRVNLERDHVFGNPKALISIIEYSDFECPYCQAFHTTPKKIVEQYQGRVNWVYRHYPLPFHNPVAQKTAEASECVAELGGNDAFWIFTDALYARGPIGDESKALADKLALVEKLGLDQAAFSECLSSAKFSARVADDLQEGSQIGINGTPGTVILNNENGAVRLVSGAVPPESLAATIEQVLN
jgi:protein-disulfide isomerase